MDRAAIIKVGSEEFQLLLTTAATKAISEKFGGLENLGESLMKSENFATALNEVNWLLCLLANQAIKRHNYMHKDNPKPELTMEFFELFTAPHELIEYKDAIAECMLRGTKRHIESENDTKNQVGE